MGGGASKKKQPAELAPIVPSGINSSLEEVDKDLVEAAKKDWFDKILWVFTKFDRDCSGGLDVNEILELMIEVQTMTDDPVVNSVKFTYPDAKLVLAALDANGNGTVEDTEFISWLSKGMAMNPDQFEKLMRSSPTNHQLATFLLGVKLYCMIEYVDEQEKKGVAEMVEGSLQEEKNGAEEPAAAEVQAEVPPDLQTLNKFELT
jgi:Ca2+-binding EF-hand superfamily protein